MFLEAGICVFLTRVKDIHVFTDELSDMGVTDQHTIQFVLLEFILVNFPLLNEAVLRIILRHL